MCVEDLMSIVIRELREEDPWSEISFNPTFMINRASDTMGKGWQNAWYDARDTNQ
jgi:hypothetical protein